MEDDTWSFAFSASSRSYQSTVKSQSDLCIDFEEIEEDDELMTEYPCPYCSEDFDLLGLCCHIDEEHHLEAGYGLNSVNDIIFYCTDPCFSAIYAFAIWGRRMILDGVCNHKLDFGKGDSYSTLSSLRKELHDAHYQSLLSRSWSSLSSSNTAPDPLLSFLYSAPPADSSESVQPVTPTEVTMEEKGSNENILEKLMLSSAVNGTGIWFYLPVFLPVVITLKAFFPFTEYKFMIVLWCAEMLTRRHCQIRSTRRRQIGVNLYKGYYYPPSLMVAYNQDRKE
ncbi:hypothetical protein GOBAR_DD14607 [Gossypium barbadense]|nr:hypothetical protein GOBAR_DD14607 [Gossypium barbadense]